MKTPNSTILGSEYYVKNLGHNMTMQSFWYFSQILIHSLKVTS